MFKEIILRFISLVLMATTVVFFIFGNKFVDLLFILPIIPAAIIWHKLPPWPPLERYKKRFFEGHKKD